MIENFSLLTKVSNNIDNFGLYLALLIIFWAVVAAELALLIYSFIRVCVTRNTVKAKWWMLPIGLIVAGGILAGSIILGLMGLQPEIWIALTVMGGLGILFLIMFYIIKTINCVQAKKHHMSERKWCAILWVKHMAKKMVAQVAFFGIRKITKHMTPAQRAKFYAKAIKIFNILRKASKDFSVTKKGILKAVSRIIENFKKGKYEDFMDFLRQEYPTFTANKKNKKDQ